MAAVPAAEDLAGEAAASVAAPAAEASEVPEDLDMDPADPVDLFGEAAGTTVPITATAEADASAVFWVCSCFPFSCFS